MNTHNHHQHPEGRPHDEAVHVEVEIEDRIEVLVIPITDDMVMVELIRTKLELDADVRLFERDRDQPLHHHPQRRKHLRVVGHRCHEVALEVRHEHLDKHHAFSPSTTVFRALQWAVGKHGYNLDPMAAAKANLILPGADQPLPREDVLGKYVKPGHCKLVVDLTLKDFTNG